MKKILMTILCFSILFCSAVETETILKKNVYTLKASYYANSFNGKKTANGSIFNNEKLTAACNLFPLNTILDVTNNLNGKSIIVKVTDRIHPKFSHSRIDLSRKAFSLIGDIKSGILKNISISKHIEDSCK